MQVPTQPTPSDDLIPRLLKSGEPSQPLLPDPRRMQL